MKELEEHIESIITRKISGEISTDEQLVLDNWLSADVKNQSYFNDLEKIYLQANKKETKKTSPIDVGFEWSRFQQTIKLGTNKKQFSQNWLRVAASVSLVAVLGYFLWVSNFKSNEIEVIANTWGKVIILPDNSEITLNKGASLTYPKKFSNNNRTVTLTGEAFFEITRNEIKPFVVNLGQSKVEVLGTSFNINTTLSNNNKIEVLVNTGKVKFSNSLLTESVILTKGEKGTLLKNNNMLTKSLNRDVNALAWKTRKIVFNDIALDKVIKTINELYDAQITFSTEIGTNCNVTVSFENQSLEAVLSVLKLTLDLEYKKSGDVIEIINTGC